MIGKKVKIFTALSIVFGIILVIIGQYGMYKFPPLRSSEDKDCPFLSMPIGIKYTQMYISGLFPAGYAYNYLYYCEPYMAAIFKKMKVEQNLPEPHGFPKRL